MSLSPPVRRVLLVVALLLLLAFSWAGLSGGVDQLSHSHSAGEKTQTFTQFAFGFFALLSVTTTFWGHRWAPVAVSGWVVSATLAGGLASVVWGGTTVVLGLLSGGASLLIALGIAWLLRGGARGLASA